MATKERKIINFDEGWEWIQMGITKILNKLEGLPGPQLTSEDYISVYTIVYNMCTQKPPPHDHSRQLYDKYREFLIQYISSTVLPSLREKHNDELMLRELVKRWADHKVMVRGLSGFLSYLDRYFIPCKSLAPVKQVGLACFRELVYVEFKGKVRDAVISRIDQERQGQQIDRDLLKNVLDMFVEIGLAQMNYFEADKLKDTAAYSSEMATNWILEDKSPGDFAMECLKREKERLEREKERKAQHVYVTQPLKYFSI